MKKVISLIGLTLLFLVSSFSFSQPLQKGYEKFNWGESIEKTKTTISKFYKGFKFYKESKTDLTYVNGKIENYDLDAISFTYKNKSLIRILLLLTKPKNKKVDIIFENEIYPGLVKKYGKHTVKNALRGYDGSYIWELKNKANVYACYSNKSGVEISFEKEK